MAAQVVDSRKSYCPWQICNSTVNFTVEEIVTAIKENIPSLEVTYVDSPIMNQLSYDVDDAKFRALGFTPHGDFKKSTQETIAHLRSIIKK